MSTCLDLVPVPGLSSAWGVFHIIWQSIQAYQESRVRLSVLAYCIAQLLCAIDGNFKDHRLVLSKVERQIAELERYVEVSNIIAITQLIPRQLAQGGSGFCQEVVKCGFLKRWIRSRDHDLNIDVFHKRISACVDAFQLATLVDIAEWQHRYDAAAAADHAELTSKLTELVINNQKLTAMLGNYISQPR